MSEGLSTLSGVLAAHVSEITRSEVNPATYVESAKNPPSPWSDSAEHGCVTASREGVALVSLTNEANEDDPLEEAVSFFSEVEDDTPMSELFECGALMGDEDEGQIKKESIRSRMAKSLLPDIATLYIEIDKLLVNSMGMIDADFSQEFIELLWLSGHLPWHMNMRFQVHLQDPQTKFKITVTPNSIDLLKADCHYSVRPKDYQLYMALVGVCEEGSDDEEDVATEVASKLIGDVPFTQETLDRMHGSFVTQTIEDFFQAEEDTPSPMEPKKSTEPVQETKVEEPKPKVAAQNVDDIRLKFLKNVQGRVLTIMEAAIPNPAQCEALKTLIKKEFRREITRYKNSDPEPTESDE
jgi:hypothetical protein